MGIALSTIGVKTSYAVESTADTRPTSGYKIISDLKGIPALDSSPNTADASTFDNLQYTSYVKLLKDLGGALGITANLTQSLFDTWEEMCDAYDTAIASGKSLWMCFDIPGLDVSAYLKVEPSRMGIPEMTANSLLETTVYITPVGEPVFDADPTYYAGNL